MHCRLKEHVSKFSSKSQKIREESAFYKHLESTHGGKDEIKTFADFLSLSMCTVVGVMSLSLYSSSLNDGRHCPLYDNFSFEGSGTILG